jgi:hypothetical protein
VRAKCGDRQLNQGRLRDEKLKKKSAAMATHTNAAYPPQRAGKLSVILISIATR